MSVRMDGETLATLYAAALSGTAHPADVCRLVDEVRWYRERHGDPRAYSRSGSAEQVADMRAVFHGPGVRAPGNPVAVTELRVVGHIDGFGNAVFTSPRYSAVSPPKNDPDAPTIVEGN